MKICLFLHGIGASEGGESGIGRLGTAFAVRGYEPKVIPYGWFGIVRPWLCNTPLAKSLAAQVSLLDDLGHTVVAVGHSNGAALLAAASRYGAPFAGLIFVNAALNRRVTIGKQVGFVINYHVPRDPVLFLAGVLPVYPPWGMLGRRGFPVDRDPRFTNVDMGRVIHGRYRCFGHKDFDDPQKYGYWAVHMAEQSDQALKDLGHLKEEA